MEKLEKSEKSEDQQPTSAMNGLFHLAPVQQAGDERPRPQHPEAEEVRPKDIRRSHIPEAYPSFPNSALHSSPIKI